jgi:hypothetical protein
MSKYFRKSTMYPISQQFPATGRINMLFAECFYFAYYDIDSMFAYISQDNKKSAEMLRSRIYEAIKQLADFRISEIIIVNKPAFVQRGPACCIGKILSSYLSDWM